jgi:phosphoribosyl 1,2-cyclic phosphate phosphodiesterase
MFLKLLGSAAAEGWPATFCACDACREARRRGGKDLRRRTTYQLGEAVHVDWGPDSYSSMIGLNVDYSALRHLFITHSHQDHWMPEELAWRRPGYSRVPDGSWLNIYGNSQTGAAFTRRYPEPDAFSMSYRQVAPFEEIALEDGVVAVPLEASHAAEDEQALNYLFHVNGRQVVIGNDTGWWRPEVWDFLAQQQLHVVVMDCTSGPLGTGPRDVAKSWVGSHHLNCEWVVEVRDELARRGALAPDCRFVANHFSHNGGWLHHQLEAYFVPRGILVGFDGLEIEV